MTLSPNPSEKHHCFGPGARNSIGRLHLPVAPKATSRLVYGASEMPKKVLAPAEALAYLDNVIKEGTDVGVVGITGPGEPFAVPEATLKTLEQVRASYPDMPLTVSTNGLGIADHVEALGRLGLSHVTVEVHAVDPAVAEKLYAWIRPGCKTLQKSEGVRLLLNAQAEAIAALKKAGITVKVNTTVFTGINAGHVGDIAKSVSAMGADIMSVTPVVPGADDKISAPDAELMRTATGLAASHIDLMPAWEGCGQKLVGTVVPESRCEDAFGPVAALPKATPERPNVAVASVGGMEVDIHLGHAHGFLIYGPRHDGLPVLLGTRSAPDAGHGDARWKQLAHTLNDCFAVLVTSAGERPRQVLGESGLRVLITDCDVAGVVDALYGGKKPGCGRQS